MHKRSKFFCPGLLRKAGAWTLVAALVSGVIYITPAKSAYAAETSWKSDVESALDQLTDAMGAAENYADAEAALEEAYNSLESSATVDGLQVISVGTDTIVLQWDAYESERLVGYNVYWAEKNLETTKFLLLDADGVTSVNEDVVTIGPEELDKDSDTVTFTVPKRTNKNYYFKVAAVTTTGVGTKSEAVESPTAVEYDAYIEALSRGMMAVMTESGVYLSWRLFSDEVDGYSDTGLTGVNFNLYRNGTLIAEITDSTNYLDTDNTEGLSTDTYVLVPVDPDTGEERTGEACTTYDIFTDDAANTDVAYIDIPLWKPANTTIRETYGVDEIALGGYTMTDSGYRSANDVISYSANDMSVADVDGDGEYEYLVKWDPSLSKDVSQQGYTGKQYIDCYELDGTLLWRLDLGINIRSGAHYTEFGVFDYDGDGKAEMIVKTAPGTKMIKYALDESGKNIKDENGNPVVESEDYVNISEEDAAAGVTDESDFVFSAEEYREYLIEVFQDWGVWSNYSEETAQNAIIGHWSNNLVEMLSVSAAWSDATFYTGNVKSASNESYNVGSMTAEDIQQYLPDYEEGDTLVNVCLRDESGNIRYVSSGTGVNPVMKTVLVEDVKDYYGGYDLASVDKDVEGIGYTEEEATILADYFLKHYEYRMKKHSLEVYEGYVITGPEYVTLYDCSNGEELDTQDWYFEREDDGLLWGDYAMNYIEPGNRNDRFNVAVAYLDGETPSCIMGRGYYTRTTMAAYNVVNNKLQVAGSIDSGWTVMTNPFNDGPHGYDGCDPVNGKLSGQGDHYIAVADIDGDGCQDIINGGAIVSYKNGEMYLYSSGGDYLNGGDETKAWAKYGHGDAIHVTDIDPDRPGLEIVSCFEGATSAPYNWALRDGETNTALFGAPGTSDFGRIIIGDVLANVRGLEIDTGYDAQGNKVSLAGVGNNMNIKWAADMSTQFVSGTSNITVIGNVNGSSHTFLRANGYVTNNSTKGNPCLVADLFGDYREELILASSGSASLRIYMNTEVSEHKNYTLMQNLQYRVGIASQNSSYNQPAYTDYYYATDTDWEYVTVPNQKKDQEPDEDTVSAVSTAAVSLALMTADILSDEGNGDTQDSNIAVYTDAAVAKMTTSPLDAYQFDFGSKDGSASNPFVMITNQAYGEELGYGFVSNTASITYNKVEDTTVIANGDSDYDIALAEAISDGCRDSEMEFAIDLPAGEYMVSVYAYDTWNGNYTGSTYYINDVQIGTFYTLGAAVTADECAMTARVVLEEDGQIIIKSVGGSKNLSVINAVTVSEYVIAKPDYDSSAWDDLVESMASLKVKTGQFTTESTPADYDAVLINKMVDVLDKIDVVYYMDLLDTGEGDAVYALAQTAVENRPLYSESSMALLEAAMKAYELVKSDLDVTEELDNVVYTIEFWLQGIDLASVPEAYSLYADFDNTQTGGSSYNDGLAWATPGWTSIGVAAGHPRLDLYDPEIGYGMLAAAGGRNRGSSDTLLSDWMGAGTFIMDLPAGDYHVMVYTGELSGTAKNQSYTMYAGFVDGNNLGTAVYSLSGITAASNSYITTEFDFSLDEDTTMAFNQSGYTIAMTIEQVIPVAVGGYDMAQLEELIAELNALSLSENDYTLSSWAAYTEAYEKAVEAVEAGEGYIQEMTTIYNNLKAAYAELVLRTAVTELALDFGPADENGSPALVWGTAPLLSSFYEMSKTNVDLGLGTMLYETNTDDNGMHYGFTSEVASGYTVTGGNYFRDFVYAEGGDPFTFKADIPVGYYYVYVYTGCKEAANTSRFYFNDGEAAAESTNMAVVQDEEGRYIYTQTSGSGSQYVAPGCIYTVRVMKNDDALSYVNGVTMGTFSITMFHDDPDLSEDEITARMCGIELCYAHDLTEEDLKEDGDVSGGDVSGGDVSGGDVSGGDVSGGDVIDTTDLEELIEEAEAVDGSQYTDDSYQAVADALENAKAVLENTEATQDEVDEAVAALREAIAALVKITDFSVLEAIVSRAEELDGSRYTSDTYAAVEEALANAREVLANADATQEEVDAAVQALNNAIAALVTKADFSALEKEIARAEQIDGSQYTEDSYAAVTEAISNAREVLANEYSTQEEIDAALQALKAAIAALTEPAKSEEESVDTSELESAVETAMAVDASRYTEESYAAVSAALANAEKVLADENSTQEQIDAALAALNNALAALEEAEADSSDNGETGIGDSSESTGSEGTGSEDTDSSTADPGNGEAVMTTSPKTDDGFNMLYVLILFAGAALVGFVYYRRKETD